MARIRNCRDLKVWQDSIKLVKMVYEIANILPANEKYGLCSQIRRAAVSVPSNIAEGHARDSLKEYLRHISIALGSLSELQTQIFIIKELNFTKNNIINETELVGNEVGKMLRGLQKALKSKLPQPPNP